MPLPCPSPRLLTAFVAFVVSVTAGPAMAAPPDDARPASQAEADEEPESYSDFYTGTFWELSGRAGLLDAERFDGQSYDVGARFAFPMHIGDTRLSYAYTALDGEDGWSATEQSVALHGLLHPLYILMLGSDWASYVASSLYLEFGLGVTHVGANATDDASIGMSWSLGSGIDVPLWDPDVGFAPWLHLLYRYQFSSTEVASDEIDLDRHAVFVGIGWRINGLPF